MMLANKRSASKETHSNGEAKHFTNALRKQQQRFLPKTQIRGNTNVHKNKNINTLILLQMQSVLV